MFIEWLSNKIPPWPAYRAFMPGLLIELDKLQGVSPVGVRENWQHLFDKCVLRVTRPKATNVYQDDKICSGLKVVTNGSIYGVQAIWYTNLSTEDWGFLMVDVKNKFNEIN